MRVEMWDSLADDEFAVFIERKNGRQLLFLANCEQLQKWLSGPEYNDDCTVAMPEFEFVDFTSKATPVSIN